MNCQQYFKGKKITLIGLGLLGRGVGDARFLAECGAELIVTDLKTEVELADSLAQLKDFKNIIYHLGGHRLEDFEACDLVIKGSGIPLDSPYVAEARRNKIPIAMSVALFAKFFKGPVIGVTGTLGKTTTAHWLDYVLHLAGKKTILAGNVQGGSTLALLPEVTSDTIAVLELDSWTLQGFGPTTLKLRGINDTGFSPQIAIFTFFSPDHLNYYHGDMDQYLADKANIFLYQESTDTLVCEESVASLLKEKFGSKIKAKVLVTKNTDVPKSWLLAVPGVHNQKNAALVLQTARLLGIEEIVIKQGLESFTGVSGRLELIAEKKGIKFYNDTAATTPLAAAAGLQALAGEKKNSLIVIAGGAGKELDPQPFVDALRHYAREIILLPGSGTSVLQPLINDLSIAIVGSLDQALDLAVSKASSGDTITLTPGFASFGPPPGGFKNMYDRGDQFARLVKKL